MSEPKEVPSGVPNRAPLAPLPDGARVVRGERAIEGVQVLPLRRIPDERGTIFHMLRASDPHFQSFGEIYFSTVYKGVIKGWHQHKDMSLNYACMVGRVKCALYDERHGSPSKGSLMEVYLGPDSALVAARVMPFSYRGTRALVLPKTRWREHGASYWSVTVDNATSGERSNGAVWRFDTPAADAPIDSVVVGVSSFGYRKTGTTIGGCGPAELLAGGGYFTGIVWGLIQQPQSLRLAGVRLDLTSTPFYADSLPGDVSAWLTIATMACGNALQTFLTDEVNGHLASGVLIGPRTVRFESDTLIAHIQAAIRLRTFYGYLFRSKQLIHFESPQGAEPAAAPVFKLYYYTGNGTRSGARPAGPQASAPGQSSPARGRVGFLPLDPRGVQSVNSR